MPATLAPGPHGDRPTEEPKARSEEPAGREEFGRALEAARARAGLTVQEAARAAGISPGEAAAYFVGSDLPPVTEAGLKALHRMLAACGIADPGQMITWTYALAKAWSLPACGAPAGDAPRRPGPAQGRIIQDVRGFDLCPDPLTAQTAAELVAALSRFRLWAGEPSFQEMRRLSQPEAAASTMCEALGSSSLPSLRVVQAIVTGCGGTAEHNQAFTTAWRNIRMNQGNYGAQPGTAARRSLYPVPGTGTGQPADTTAAPPEPGRKGRGKRRPA